MEGFILDGVRSITATSMEASSPAQHEVAIAPRVIGICGSDLAAYRGSHPRMKPPLILGHEFAGSVLSVGAAVRTVRPGDRVAVDPIVACGVCRHCVAGQVNVCPEYKVVGCHPSVPGAFAEVVCVNESQVRRMPESCSFTDAALAQPLAISHHAAAVRGAVGASEHVVILGAGPIGLGCLLVSRALGATVVMGDLDHHRLTVAADLGAEATVDVARPDVAEALGTASGEPPDVVIDATGGPQSESLQLARASVSNGGRIVVVGNFSEGIAAADAAQLKARELTLLGAQGYQQSSYQQVLNMIGSGQLDAARLVSHRLPVTEVADAFALFDDDTVDTVKIVLSRGDPA